MCLPLHKIVNFNSTPEYDVFPCIFSCKYMLKSTHMRLFEQSFLCLSLLAFSVTHIYSLYLHTSSKHCIKKCRKTCFIMSDNHVIKLHTKLLLN